MTFLFPAENPSPRKLGEKKFRWVFSRTCRGLIVNGVESQMGSFYPSGQRDRNLKGRMLGTKIEIRKYQGAKNYEYIVLLSFIIFI